MNEIGTYQMRLDLSFEQAALLDAYAALHGKAERSLTVLKREFIGGLGITARQFNALAAGVRGKIACVKEVRDRLIESAKRRMKRAEDVLAEITDKWKRHQKRRRIATFKVRLANLESERDAGKMGIGFGSRKLFREQFALEENGFASPEEWLAECRKAQSSQFFAMGSRDETAGCQSCVAAVQDDGSVTLRLRLPDALGAGKHLAIERVRFAYGHDAIVAAIGRNLSEDKAEWQAISYRFVHDVRGWRVFVSIAIPEVAMISSRQAGVIGVDINADHLAVTETDRFGNPVGSWVIHYVTYGRTSERRAAIVGDAVKQVVAIAVDRCKPIAIEKLDFSGRTGPRWKPSRGSRPGCSPRSPIRGFRPSFGLVVTMPGSRCWIPTRRIARSSGSISLLRAMGSRRTRPQPVSSRGELLVSGSDCRVSSRSPRSYSRRIAAGMGGACGRSSPAETEWRMQRGGGRIIRQPDPRRHRLLRTRPAR
jgi:hypothetical protein